ncbi:ABC transporter substrate-binding protein [Streptomyces sp. MI02-7b]|uniref:ABC transporter substrate-binding protein n=1 Tax=Streptomyces sp. MI02-7b TaxID=462941 RepID=UPI0029B05CD0|nr:ABC transporter substrate-binding protein [Streptomyces sp. MI02-7b]MDX3075126.1 ABC transporter substrate-binding protein [Streptomyces sp. MI02-7b]
MRKRVQLLALPLSATAILATGCGSGGGDGGGEGKSVTMGITDKVTAVDPASGYDVGSWIVFNNVFQSLMSFPKGATKPEPEAAENCAFTDTASRTFDCTLRPGLKFSNGDDLTSQDVKYSFERTIKINDENGPAVLLDSIKTIDTPSAARVVFHLKYSDATFPMKIASGAGSIVDHREYPADKLREDDKAIGSGPYRLDTYTAGDQAVFSVNDRYQGTAEVHNSGMTMKFFAEESGLEKALESGSVDLAYRGLAAKDIAALQQKAASGDSGMKVVEGTGAEVQHLVFNVKDPVVASKAVRRAVAYLIDRKAIIRDVYDRTASPLYSIVPQGITGHNTAFFDRYGEGADTAAAQAALTDAGITDKVRFTLWGTPVRYGPGTVPELTEIAQQLNSSGLFDVDVKTTDADQYAKDISKGKYAVYVRGWVPDYPDPDNFTAPFFGDGNVLSNNYVNQRISGQLIPRTAAQAARASTTADFEELQDTVADDVPIIPLWQGKQYVAAKDTVNGLEWTLDPSTVFRFWEIQKVAQAG